MMKGGVASRLTPVVYLPWYVHMYVRTYVPWYVHVYVPRYHARYHGTRVPIFIIYHSIIMLLNY
jgi:hypothetical protein